MIRLLPALLAVALSASSAGCFACDEQLDVHRCLSETGRCDTAGEVAVQWDPELGALWPDVARLLDEVEPGRHGHAAWTPEQAAAFWSFWHVPADRPDKQVYFRHDGALFHVRVLEC